MTRTYSKLRAPRAAFAQSFTGRKGIPFRWLLAFAMAVLTIPMPAAAEFVLQPLKPVVTPADTPQPLFVSQSERDTAIPADLAAVPTSHILVRDVPVEEAIAKLVPNPLKVQAEQAIRNVRVSYASTGAPWPIVLRDTLAAKGLSFTLEGTTLRISQAPSQKTTIAKAQLDPLSEARLPSIHPPAVLVSAELSAAEPSPIIWKTTPGLSLRSQIRRWTDETNDEYHLVDRDADDPPEPDWRITEADSYTGDLLGALAWVRDGFSDAPRPDVVVKKNKRILLHVLGAAQ